jgi:hypothetical protein
LFLVNVGDLIDLQTLGRLGDGADGPGLQAIGQKLIEFGHAAGGDHAHAAVVLRLRAIGVALAQLGKCFGVALGFIVQLAGLPGDGRQPVLAGVLGGAQQQPAHVHAQRVGKMAGVVLVVGGDLVVGDPEGAGELLHQAIA